MTAAQSYLNIFEAKLGHAFVLCQRNIVAGTVAGSSTGLFTQSDGVV